MKKIVALLFIVASVTAVSNAQGIEFQEGSYKQVLKMARKQNKLLFVDMSITGCKPCHYMKKNVFVLPEVGQVYNDKFVNWHVNCMTNDDGMQLSEEHGVRSFPTYLWIDAETGQVIHRVSGGRSPEVFIELAEVPFVKEETSSYLLEQYTSGNRDFDLLADLYFYYKFNGQKGLLAMLEDDFYMTYGFDFSHQPLVEFYFEHINRKKSRMSKYLIEHQEEMIKRYGKEKVLNKIANLK